MTLMTFIPAIILASVYGFIAYIVRIHTKGNFTFSSKPGAIQKTKQKKAE